MPNKLFLLTLLILWVGLSNIAAQQPIGPVPKTISGGVVNGKATNLVKPVYPAAAKAVRASGAVNVQVTIDEEGNVISASAVSGHPLLRAAAVVAARESKFSPTMLSGQVVKVTGVVVYNFVLPLNWHSIGYALGDAEIEIEEIDGLQATASDLADNFSKESAQIKNVIANFQKDEENARNQTPAFADIIISLQQKLTDQPEDLWYFELGLAKGRITANYFDDSVLRNYLPRIKELADSMPEAIKKESSENRLESLTEISEMANKSIFSRKDKNKIKELVDDL